MADNMATRERKRRQYGSGSVFPTADGRWRGTFEAGYTDTGARRRITVTAKTEAQAKTKLRDRMREAEQAGAAKAGRSPTVKAWAAEWLTITERTLAPKSWQTNAGQVRKWIVPTLGHKRLNELTHADVRAVAIRQRQGKQAASSITRCKAVLMKMLKDAVTEGYTVPEPVIAVQPRKKRTGRKEKREALEIDQALNVLTVARQRLPHHSRWDLAFLQGLRQGEALGLTWDAVDLDNRLLTVEWQLQALPYIDRADKALGFRVPDDYEARHLHGAFHLVRPKTGAGERVIPLVPWAADTLAAWREVAPANPHGLVWTRPDGRPIDKGDDLTEWKALQAEAQVEHPSGRSFRGHEIRNTTATLLFEAGVDEGTIVQILGHTDVRTSAIYRTHRAEKARPAMEAVARALGID